MQIPKKICAFCMAALLTGSSMVQAAGLQNFKQTSAYQNGQFADVNSQWYADAVQSAYQFGLMQGTSSDAFSPEGNITHAEAVAIAARLHSIYYTGGESFASTSPWYQSYWDYAVANGICDTNFPPEQTASRGFFAGVLGNAVEAAALEERNPIADGALRDVTDWYAGAVYRFYRAGILSGNDPYGTFAPDSAITRAEAAAIATRIILPEKRRSVQLIDLPFEGNFNIVNDDGSLDAYRQWALVANFRVLLGQQEKTPEWETNVYNIYHPEIPGEPEETIIIPMKSIKIRYIGDYDKPYDALLYFDTYLFDPSLIAQIGSEFPVLASEIKNQETYHLNGKEYSCTFNDHGDLVFYYPGTPTKQAAWTETITFDNYTGEAQQMIANAAYTPAPVDLEAIRALAAQEYGSRNDLQIIVGQLTDWEGTWYINMNEADMSRPTPNGSPGQTAYEFRPVSAGQALSDWCTRNFGNYVFAVLGPTYDTAVYDTPIMVGVIDGYLPTKDGAAVQSWDFLDNQLILHWAAPHMELADTLTVYSGSTVQQQLDTSNVEPAAAFPAYNILYAEDGTIQIHNCKEPKQNSASMMVTLQMGSDTATVSRLSYGEKTGADTTVTVAPPRVIGGRTYLPGAIRTLLPLQNNIDTTGLVALELNPGNIYSFTYHGETYRFMYVYSGKNDDGTPYLTLSFNYDLHIFLTPGSTEGSVWNSRKPEEEKESAITLPYAPKEIDGVIYVPPQPIVEAIETYRTK